MNSKDRRVLEELIKRDQRAAKVDFEAIFFPQQRAFVEDEARLKAALCTRRAGKTYGAVAFMLKTALQYAFCIIPYFSLTKKQARNNIWNDLQLLNRDLKLGGKFNNTEHTLTLPNGSQIQLWGADDASEIEKLRGGKYPLAVIDEAASYGSYLRVLIQEVLMPAVSDYRGSICLIGTPGIAPAGFFYEVTTQCTEESKAWSVHRWNVVDNPYHKEFGGNAQALEEWRIQNRWAPDNPTFLREWKGLWVEDNDLRVYKYKSSVNDCPSAPKDEGDMWVLGLDLGYEDSTGFVILRYNEFTGKLLVLRSWKKAHLIPSAMAAEVDRLRSFYDFSKIVADTGGFGKGYVEEMRQRFGMNIEAAQKTNKRGYIDLLNGDLQSGVIQIVRQDNLALIDEMASLRWETDEEGKINYEKIDERFEDHLCDALLYGWRSCRQFLNDFEIVGPKAGTPAWNKLQEEQMEEAELKHAGLHQQDGPWWAEGYDDFGSSP